MLCEKSAYRDWLHCDTKNERAPFHRSFQNWRVKKVSFDAIKATLALFIPYE
jgi:hypothetical protein